MDSCHIIQGLPITLEWHTADEIPKGPGTYLIRYIETYPGYEQEKYYAIEHLENHLWFLDLIHEYESGSIPKKIIGWALLEKRTD